MRECCKQILLVTAVTGIIAWLTLVYHHENIQIFVKNTTNFNDVPDENSIGQCTCARTISRIQNIAQIIVTMLGCVVAWHLFEIRAAVKKIEEKESLNGVSFVEFKAQRIHLARSSECLKLTLEELKTISEKIGKDINSVNGFFVEKNSSAMLQISEKSIPKTQFSIGDSSENISLNMGITDNTDIKTWSIQNLDASTALHFFSSLFASTGISVLQTPKKLIQDYTSMKSLDTTSLSTTRIQLYRTLKFLKTISKFLVCLYAIESDDFTLAKNNTKGIEHIITKTTTYTSQLTNNIKQNQPINQQLVEEECYQAKLSYINKRILCVNTAALYHMKKIICNKCNDNNNNNNKNTKAQ